MKKRVVFYFLVNIIPIFLLLVVFDFSWLTVGLMTLGIIFSCIFWCDWYGLNGTLSDPKFTRAVLGLIFLLFGSFFIWKDLLKKIHLEKIHLDPQLAGLITTVLFVVIVIVCYGIFMGGLFSAEKIEKFYEKKTEIKPV